MAKYIDIESVGIGKAKREQFLVPEYADGWNHAIEIFENEPAANVEEVRCGEWIPVQYTYFGLKRYECSECKDDEYWQKRYLEHKEKYCPNCGARMNTQ